MPTAINGGEDLTDLMDVNTPKAWTKTRLLF
jgi:hypothetical protein